MKTKTSINHCTPPDAKHLLSAGVIRVLIACEESDEVRGRFEALGFDAWSCDLEENRNPKAKHYKGNIFDIINRVRRIQCR